MSKNRHPVYKRIFLVFALCCGALFSTLSAALPSGMLAIDTHNMSTQLDAINQKILNVNDNYEDLTEALHAINILQRELEQCIKRGETQLKKVNHLLNEPDISSAIKKDLTSYHYLSEERNKTLTQVESCHFLDYRLGEITDIATNKIDKVSKFMLLKKIPELAPVNTNALLTTPFNTQSIKQHSGIERLDKMNGGGLALTFMIGLIVALALRKNSALFINSTTTINRDFILFILPLGLVCIYLNILFFHTSPSPILMLIMNATSLFVITLFIVKLYFSIGIEAHPNSIVLPVFVFSILAMTLFYLYIEQFLFYKNNTLSLSSVDFRKATYIIVIIRLFISCFTGFPKWLTGPLVASLQHRMFLIATIALLNYVLQIILATQSLSAGLSVLLDTLDITLLNIAYLLLIYPFLNRSIPNHYRKIAAMGFIICVSNILAAWYGYHYLAMTCIPNLIITAVVIVIIMDIYRYIKKTYALFTAPHHAWSIKIHRFFGLKEDEKLVEIYILLLLAQLPALTLAALSLMEIWGVTRYEVFLLFSHAHSGMSILGLGESVRLPLVLRGITFYCLIVLSGRALATHIERAKLAHEDEHTRVIVFSLIQYLFGTIGILAALYIMGFNFRSLVVVAGAFSVGLGFGLQNIAKDFICGLIIMINKPIKIGDHIEVGDRNKNEGFIRKIGVLSTQLHTLSYSEVIIPNSEIITKIFTNFTFQSNALSRIKLTVSLDKDSDFDLAKQLLLDVAMKNPNVIQVAPYQPIVLFELYDLTLWFVIDDINKKDSIISQLNLAIAYGLKGI